MSEAVTPERLAELRRIAEAATPGPWRISGDGPADRFVIASAEGEHIAETTQVDSFTEDLANARHIATFDPTTVLALLDEIKRLQQKVQRANALAVAVEQVLKAWSMGDYLTPFMYDLGNALLDFEGPVASEDGWLEVVTDGEEGGASDA